MSRIKGQIGKRTYTTQEAAAFLRLHINTLANMRSKGKGPKYLKTGPRVRYLKADLEAYQKEQIKYITPGDNNV